MRVLALLWVTLGPVQAAFLRPKGQAAKGQLSTLAEPRDESGVRKPKMDKRRYEHRMLRSGLRVLLVEDPEAQKSSYAMAVEVGSLEDPKDFQGLAHFCEHMVFLGSKKYPKEDEFSDKLAFYGGTNNAYTASDQTVYFAEVDDKGFDETFDIFAQFFIEPSFAPKMVDKEVNAVDSEHKKNMADTTWRLIHLLKSRANPKSPVSKFSTGTLETLKLEPEKAGKSLPEALQKFHQENYCSSRMHLVIMRNASIEQQLAAAERSFGSLSSKGCEARPYYDDIPMFSHELDNLGRKFKVHTDGSPQLWLTFPMMSLQGQYKTMPEAYINYALSHYGPGSLKALLKREDLALHYSTMLETTPAGSVLTLIFSLTPKGAEESDRIIEHTFAYFNTIKKNGVDKALIQTMKSLNQVMFDYQDRSGSDSGFVTSLAGSLPKVQFRDVLTGGVLIDTVNVSMTQKLMEAIHPQNMNVALVTNNLVEGPEQKHEKYYDFNYTEEALPAAQLLRWASAESPELWVPPRPQYVPQRLELIEEDKPQIRPKKIQDTSSLQLWWLGLGGFQIPKAQVQIKVKHPRSVLASPARAVLSAMHARLVNLVLEEPSDAFQMCGISYSVASASDGLSVSFSGFNEHLAQLQQLVLPKLREPQVKSSDFEMIRRQMMLELQDVTSQQPYQHALEALELVSVTQTHSRKAMLQAVQDVWAVSLTEHQAMLDEILAAPQLLVLVSGNLAPSDATAFATEALQILSVPRHSGLFGPVAGLWDRFYSFLFGGATRAGKDGARPLVLKIEKDLEVRVPNPISKDTNSATITSYQFGVPSLADRLRFSLISGIIDRPVFQILRTEHQLGYVVFGFATAHVDILEVRILVQGFRETPDVVATLIDQTVKNLTQSFHQMSPKEFEVRKDSLRCDLKKPAANLGEFAGHFWSQIWDETYCFDKMDKELKLLDNITLPSLAKVWEETTQSLETRKKMTVKLFGSNPSSGEVAIPVQKDNASALVTDLEHLDFDEAPRWPHRYVCE